MWAEFRKTKQGQSSIPGVARDMEAHSQPAVSHRRIILRPPSLPVPLSPARATQPSNPLTGPGRASSQAEEPVILGLSKRLHQGLSEARQEDKNSDREAMRR